MGDNPENQVSEWETFWKAYPRREAKKDARKAWAQLNGSVPLNEILKALSWQTKLDQWKRGFIPLPATYLRGERWTDEPPSDMIQAIPCATCKTPLTGAWTQSPSGRVCNSCWRAYRDSNVKAIR